MYPHSESCKQGHQANGNRSFRPTSQELRDLKDKGDEDLLATLLLADSAYLQAHTASLRMSVIAVKQLASGQSGPGIC